MKTALRLSLLVLVCALLVLPAQAAPSAGSGSLIEWVLQCLDRLGIFGAEDGETEYGVAPPIESTPEDSPEQGNLWPPGG
jgi:hypothetical protein